MNEIDEKVRHSAENDPLYKAVTDLIVQPEKLPIAARIKNCFLQIERARAMGYSAGMIVEALNKAGIKITLSVFYSVTYRIRKQRAKATKKDARKETKSDSR